MVMLSKKYNSLPSPKHIVFLSLKIDLVLANSVDTDEMSLKAAFYLGLHCLPKYPFLGVLALQRVKSDVKLTTWSNRRDVYMEMLFT